MQKKGAGSENLIGVGGSTKDGAAKICGQLVVGLFSNFKNRILGGYVCCLVTLPEYHPIRLRSSTSFPPEFPSGFDVDLQQSDWDTADTKH